MRILLHACCGPCAIEPLDALAGDHSVGIVYANPNIHPVGEYERRRDTLLDYAGVLGVPVVEEPYEPARWMRAVAGQETDPGSRCGACYLLRLRMVALAAVRDGYDAIATTLTVSPYQDPESIRAAGVRAADESGIAYVDTDFRPQYRSAVDRSRELGMYRQRYCGCLLSEVEAQVARERRKPRRG